MKANELKTTDLMVGDWVSCQINSIELKYVRIASLNKTTLNGIPTDFIEFNKVMVDMLHGNYYQVDIASIHPIPLTTEILEKNGFKTEKIMPFEQEFEHRVGVDGRVMLDNRSEYICSNNTWAMYIRGDRGITSYIELSFLHQLQHALKLCGINKEITL